MLNPYIGMPRLSLDVTHMLFFFNLRKLPINEFGHHNSFHTQTFQKLSAILIPLREFDSPVASDRGCGEPQRLFMRNVIPSVAGNVQRNSLGLLDVQDGFNSTNAVSAGM